MFGHKQEGLRRPSPLALESIHWYGHVNVFDLYGVIYCTVKNYGYGFSYNNPYSAVPEVSRYPAETS